MYFSCPTVPNSGATRGLHLPQPLLPRTLHAAGAPPASAILSSGPPPASGSY